MRAEVVDEGGVEGGGGGGGEGQLQLHALVDVEGAAGRGAVDGGGRAPR